MVLLATALEYQRPPRTVRPSEIWFMRGPANLTPISALPLAGSDAATASAVKNRDAAEYCDMIFANEPIEDPGYICWLSEQGREDTTSDKLQYVCVQAHPCLDILDDFDHSEDSY